MPLDFSVSPIAEYVRLCKQKAINSAAASFDLLAAKPGLRFSVIHLYIEAEGATDLSFLSGATPIAGPFAMAANEVLELKNSGAPVLIGEDVNKALVVSNSGTAQLNGFVVYTWVGNRTSP